MTFEETEEGVKRHFEVDERVLHFHIEFACGFCVHYCRSLSCEGFGWVLFDEEETWRKEENRRKRTTRWSWLRWSWTRKGSQGSPNFIKTRLGLLLSLSLSLSSHIAAIPQCSLWIVMSYLLHALIDDDRAKSQPSLVAPFWFASFILESYL